MLVVEAVNHSDFPLRVQTAGVTVEWFFEGGWSQGYSKALTGQPGSTLPGRIEPRDFGLYRTVRAGARRQCLTN